jgi:hypothetical protein
VAKAKPGELINRIGYQSTAEVSGEWHRSPTARWCGYLLLVLTNRFPTTANNDKLRQSLSFFGKEWRKIAGLTEIAIE